MANPPFVIANLIVGADGSTTKAGSSIGLSTPADRKLFNELRAQSAAIIIGGNTARREPYKKTPIPLYIITHSNLRLQPKNQLAKQINLPPASAMESIFADFKEQPNSQLLVEAGPKLLQELIELNLVQRLYLTVNLKQSGENKIDLNLLLSKFELIENEEVDGCEFKVFQLTK